MKGFQTKRQLTAVTVNLNSSKGLARTIESVRALEIQDFQYLIIDGGSKDSSLEIIRQNSDLIDDYISEPDGGIYDAMNKAQTATHGQYILFLNSGDYFANPQVLNGVDLSTGEDLIYGNHTYHNPLTGQTGVTRYDGVLDLEFFWRTTIPHCSTFIKRSCLDAGGWFDRDYPIAADWVFFCKAVLERGCPTRHLDKPISIFELGGVSTIQANSANVREERDRFMRSFLPRHVFDYVTASESTKIEKDKLVSELLTLQRQLDDYNRNRIKYRASQALHRLKRKIGTL